MNRVSIPVYKLDAIQNKVVYWICHRLTRHGRLSRLGSNSDGKRNMRYGLFPSPGSCFEVTRAFPRNFIKRLNHWIESGAAFIKVKPHLAFHADEWYMKKVQ